MEITNKKSLSKFKKTFLYFIFYAFFGWVCEELYAAATVHTFIKRGFLFGPICPIYGCGALILILFFKDYKNKPIRLFFLSAIVFSIFEYVTDFFLQALFAIRWWDYSRFLFNLNGRITLSFSLIWGFAALIFIKILHPLVTKAFGKILSKIPLKLENIIIFTIALIFTVDTLSSTLSYLLIPIA